MTEPLFTIVIPTYNRAHLVRRTVESALRQEYNRYEVIVVDDGSTDNTEEVIKSIRSDRLSYYWKENAERAAARNFGAARARGLYVNFIDSDDLALPHHLLEAEKVVAKYGHPEWFHLGFAWALPDGTEFLRVNGFKGDTLQNYIPAGNPLGTSGVFVRKDIVAEHPFDETRALSGSEDYELWYRLAARFPLVYSNEVTSYLVDHDCRSVRTMSGDALIRRMSMLLACLRKDQAIASTYGSKFRDTRVGVYSHLALQLSAFTAWKLVSLQYLAEALLLKPKSCLQRRCLATLRNLVLRWH